MCSIIGLTGTLKDLNYFMKDECKSEDFIKSSLAIKGGDEYSLVINIKGFHKQFFNLNWKIIQQYLNNAFCHENEDISMLFFSRLTPEMELSESITPQPYYNRHDDTWYAVHGTIPNAEEFADVKVDTEIFMHSKNIKESLEFIENQNAKVSVLGFNENTLRRNNPISYTNGLGMYEYLLKKEPSFKSGSFNINMFSNLDLGLDYIYLQNKEELENTIVLNKPKTRIISLFSGGLDITCSTWKVIDKYKTEIINTEGSIDLWYFDWGTNASFGEKSSLFDMSQYKIPNYIYKNIQGPIPKGYSPVKINNSCIETKNMFANILQVSTGKDTTRLTETDSKGAGSHEAEAAISYVPFRNTFLLTLAAARAEERYPNDKCIFVIGANLSEGMIYLDNSESFISRMNQLVKVGGQKTYNFEVQAPYVNRTKTSMIEDAIANDYDFTSSFSCYFPNEDGTECGSCGSCILKNEAIKRAKK